MQFEKLLSMVENINSSFGGILERIVKDVIDGFDQALKEEFKENLFMTRSVEEIVWGYKDPFLKFLGDFNLPIAAIPKDGMFRLEVTNIMYCMHGMDSNDWSFFYYRRNLATLGQT